MQRGKQVEQFVIRIAGRLVGMEPVYRRMFAHSRAYWADGIPEITVSATADEIAKEYTAYTALYPNTDPLNSDLEMMLILRKVANAMLTFDTFLMHGAVVAVGGSAYMFTAKSGTGKTTHIIKWLKNLPDAYVVNGDKPLIIAGDTPMACGTPWCGKERMGTNTIVPLKAIVFMDRAENNAIRPMSFMDAFPRLLSQTHRPETSELMSKTVKLLASLNKRVQFYHFDFNNLKDDAFQVAYHALIEGEG